MKIPFKIITHPGAAHMDEYLAISLVLAFFDTLEISIERREPSLNEMLDPAIWVTDIGGNYDPDLHNFDHHQDSDLPASFVLIAEYLKVFNSEISPKEIFPWYTILSKVDTSAKQVADEFEIELKNLFHLMNNPLVRMNLEIFRQETDSAYSKNHMFLLGQFIIKEYQNLVKAVEEVDVTKIMIKDREFLSTASVSTFVPFVMGMHKKKNPEVLGTISPDDRGTGLAVYSYNTDILNLSSLSEHPEVSFAHPAGFIMKTKEILSIFNLIGIIEPCIVE